MRQRRIRTTVSKRKGLWQVFRLLVVLWIIQFFFVDFKFIKSPGMSAGILPGEIILISKLHTGARTPITPLSVPFSEWFAEPDIYSNAIRLEPSRLPGLFTHYQGQVIAFNRPDETDIPIDKKPFHLSRILGLPGDTIQFKKGELKLNNKSLTDMPNTLFPFQVKVKDGFRTDYIGMLGIEEWNALEGNTKKFTAFMTNKQASELMQLKQVTYAKKDLSAQSDDDLPIYGPGTWSSTQFGPMIMPYEGLTIELNARNLEVYGKLMMNHEDVIIEDKSGAVYLNGKEETQYTFKTNYLFVLGDNLYNTIDSRHFGPVPVSHVIGSPWIILWSFRPNSDSMLKAARVDRWFTFVAQ